MNVTHLTLKWSVSRARDTYGYNIRTLTDDSTGKKYRCNGGGYDMTGTVFAEWLSDVYADRIMAIADRAYDGETNRQGLYGMRKWDDGRVSLDGGCGIESIIRIAEAIGLDVSRIYGRSGGETAIVVTESGDDES